MVSEARLIHPPRTNQGNSVTENVLAAMPRRIEARAAMARGDTYPGLPRGGIQDSFERGLSIKLARIPFTCREASPLHDETGNVRWNELLRRDYLPRIAILCMAVWLHATNSMLTATTMPSAVDEIGGLSLISWTFALYLAGSISAAASMSMVVARLGLRRTMMSAAVVYTAGCVLVASAPQMPVLLLGRVLQGVGGGSLIALVYVAQDRFFPNRLVPKVVGLISMIWMLAALSGPAIGGAFANWGLWRMAFWFFAVQGLLLVPAIHGLLRNEVEPEAARRERIPWYRIAFLCAAILLFSLSGES